MLLVVIAALGATGQLVDEVDRFPGAFEGLRYRPPPEHGSVGMLVVATYGSGSRSTWLPGHRRAAMVMVVHVARDRRGAAVVALPLAARVAVPGHGQRRLGSMFVLGGPALAVNTVESLTRIRIEQVAVVDWHVFELLADRLGGLQLALDPDEVGPISPSTGAEHGFVDGDTVTKFVTEPGVGPVAHLHRRLIVLDEVMRTSLHQEMHKSPLLLYRFLRILAPHLAVDDSWSAMELTRFAASQWRLRSADIRYVTAPLTCRGSRQRCRVALDESAAPAFWDAVREDQLDEWLLAHHLRGAANRQRLAW